MTQPSFISLTAIDATANISLLTRHYDPQEKNTELLFGAWAWGHRFIRIDKNEKLLYRTIYWIFSKVRLFHTEETHSAYFKALKEASEKKFKQLAAPYVQALTSANETLKADTLSLKAETLRLKAETVSVEALRAAAVADIHALKKEMGKLIKAKALNATNPNQEIKPQTDRIDLLETFNSQATDTYKNLKDELIEVENKYTEEKKQLQAKIDTMQAELDDLLQTAMPLKEENEKLKEEITKLNKDITQFKSELELCVGAAGKRLRFAAHPHDVSVPAHSHDVSVPAPHPQQIEEPPITLTLPIDKT